MANEQNANGIGNLGMGTTNTLWQPLVSRRSNAQEYQSQQADAATAYNPQFATGGGYNPNLINGAPSAAIAKVDPSAVPGAQAATMNAAQVQGYTPDANAQAILNNDYKNPYLDQQVNSALGRLGDNFTQQLGGIRGSAVSNGAYGGSRQGIAEGLAAKGLSQAQGDTAASMYSNAYNTGFGARANLTGQLTAGGLAANQTNAGLQQGANQQNAANQQSAFNQNSGFGQQAALANAGYFQQGNQFNTGLGFSAAQGNQNAQNTAGQYNAGLAQNNSQFNAGQQNTANQFNTGQANNMSQFNTGQQNAYNQGMTGISNSYDLGLRNNDLGYANLDSNNAQFGANFGLNTANSAANWANQGVTSANNMQNTPINYFNNFMGNANTTAGMGGTTSQTNQGNPYMSALGGMQIANQFYKG